MAKHLDDDNGTGGTGGASASASDNGSSTSAATGGSNMGLILGIGGGVLFLIIAIVLVVVFTHTTATKTPAPGTPGTFTIPPAPSATPAPTVSYNTPAPATIPPSGSGSGAPSQAPGPSSPLSGTAAIALGNYAPNLNATWGCCSDFALPTASYVWNTAGAVSNAPNNWPSGWSSVPYPIPANSGAIWFETRYTNTTGSPISAVFHVIIDNFCAIYMNGTFSGTTWSAGSTGQVIAQSVSGGWNNNGNYPKFNVTVPSGTSTFLLPCWNSGGPAALIAGLASPDGLITYFVTDSSWVWN